MNHSMYGVDRQTDMNCFSLSAIAAMVGHSPIVVSRSAYRTSVPNGYEREFWNGFGACHNKLTPPLLRRAVAHHKKSVIAPGSSAKFSHRTMFDLHSHERWGMEGIDYGN